MSQPNTASTSASASTPTSALAPPTSGGMNSTKRLSTMKTPGSPKGTKGPTGAGAGVGGVKDVVSPGELCGFVDTLLSQLETRFDEMSEQVLSKMNEMSSRIDNLEGTIQDLMTGDLDTPAPAPKSGTGPAGRQGSISSTPTPAPASAK